MAPSPCGSEACAAAGPLASRPLAPNEDLWLRAVAGERGHGHWGQDGAGIGAREVRLATCDL